MLGILETISPSELVFNGYISAVSESMLLK